MSLKQKLKYVLPVPVKKALKYGLYSLQDFTAYMNGEREPGYPPKRLNFVGSNEFKKVGDEFLEHFINQGELKPHHKVLDIGCGIGRMAIPLTKYLTRGTYAGFDINRQGVNWCQKNISPKYPNFSFEYVDIYNKYYNKNGSIKADKFIFPHSENQFDFIFATSVFTHMLPAQIEQYLNEISRVLKPGGTAFLTWFAIDEEAKQNLDQGKTYCDFKYKIGKDCFYSHANNPEAETAYNHEWVINQMKRVGCDQNLRTHFGSWAKREKSLSYQDIIISQKGA